MALFVMGLQRGNIRTALAVPMLHAQELGVECAVVDAAHEASNSIARLKAWSVT